MLGRVKLCGKSKVLLTVPGWSICIPFWTTQGVDTCIFLYLVLIMGILELLDVSVVLDVQHVSQG
jgi:hypothetical protein